MQVSELHQLTSWVEDSIINTSLSSHYTGLQNVLNQNAQRRNNQPAQPFETQKSTLIEALSSINSDELTNTQIATLNQLELKDLIGNEGVAKIEHLLSNTLDIAQVAKTMQEYTARLNSGISKVQAIKAALSPILHESDADISKGKVLTRVVFHHDASINNIKDLKSWTNKWFEIGRGFSIANGQTPEDVEVIGAAKGSIIIELALLATTALPIAKAINLTVDSLVKFQDFRLKSLQIRDMKNENPKLEKELEEDAERWDSRAQQVKDDAVNEITDEIKNTLENFKEEHSNELNKAVRNLVDFMSKGGDVECVVSDDESDEEEVDKDNEAVLLELKQSFAQLKNSKKNLRLEDLSKK